MSRWMRLGIATITSTALVGGALVVVPSHPLLSVTQVANAQEIPASADAYAFAQQLDLSAPGLRGLLGVVAGERRSVDQILALIEAEQAWSGFGDNGQAPDGPDQADLLQLLRLLTIDLGAVTVPLLGDGDTPGLLDGDLGLLGVGVHAPRSDKATAHVGLLGADGLVDVGGASGAGNANLDLITLLGLESTLGELVQTASLEIGALGAYANKDGATVTRDYQIAGAEVVIESSAVGNIVGAITDIVGDDETGVTGIVNELTNVDLELGLIADLTVNVDAPLGGILGGVLNTTLTDESGLVEIDLANGEIRVDLEKVRTGGLNDLGANTPLLDDETLLSITDTVTSLLTDSATKNPNGLMALLDKAIKGDPATGHDGLYDLGVDIDVEVLSLPVIGGAVDLDIETTIGALLNGSPEMFTDRAAYDALSAEERRNSYLIDLELLDIDLSVVTGILGTVIDPALALVGNLVNEVLFTERGLLGGILGDVQSEVLTPLLGDLNPLLKGVDETLAGITINRQSAPTGDLTNGQPGTLYSVSALELNLLGDAVVLPLATAAVSALNEELEEPGGSGEGDIAAPVITPIDNQVIDLSEAIDPVEVKVTGEDVTVEVSGLPEGVTYNSETKVISGTPADEGIYTVTVTATNKGGVDAETFIIRVTDGEDNDGGDSDIAAPVVTPIPNQEGVVGEVITPVDVEVTGEDVDVEVAGLPAGVTYDSDTGTISGTPAEGTEGNHTVIVTATNEGGTDAESFIFTVTDRDDDETPTTPGGSTDGDDFISGSSAFLEKCMASPVGAITGLLAVLGTAAAIGGPAIDPLVKAIGGQLDAQLRALSSNVGPDQPEWVQGINKGLNDAANAIDSRMVAAALFATALGALVAAPALCEDEGSSGSSI